MYSIKSCGYCAYLRSTLSFLIVFFLSTVFSQNIQANTLSELQANQNTCKATIDKIEIAKADHLSNINTSTTHWTTIPSLPDYWEQRWPNYHGVAWYKLSWNYNCNDEKKEPISLFIENINMAGKIYLNGEFLWSDLSTQEPLSRSWFMPRNWILPASSLNHGKNNLIIEVSGSVTQKSGLGKLKLGPYEQIIQNYNKAAIEKRTLPSLNLMINLIIFLFCFMAWMLYPKEIDFFWFSLVSLAWVIYLGITLYPESFFSLSSMTIDKIHVVSFCWYTAIGCLAAWRFAHKKYDVLEKLLWCFCLSVTLIIFLIPEAFLKLTMNVIFGIAVAIFLAKCFSYPFIAYKSKIKEAYLLAFCYLFFIPIAINDAIYMLTHKGMILSPYTSPLSSLLVGLILAIRISTNQKKVEKFNSTLEQTILQTESELTASLRSQYALSLENAKLQERINLSHDLHDGIGGSIVRSMILVDKSEKVEKPLMMSILKLLRNDLRQAIDFGSGMNGKIPENPIIWAAPIRHRFIQFFEETDVKSTWQFPNEWIIPPTPIQTLTLARVTEEALNNIVKHSKATEVKISLTMPTEGKLVLEIHDNGVGFDLNTVQAGFHVGLQSMQIRVERIGGIFQIESEPKSTTIRATLTNIVAKT